MGTEWMIPPPNILLLQGEDVGRHLSCYPGQHHNWTPHLDQLASAGCRYDQAFSTSPVCSPSRGGMITGRFPWSSGLHHHRSHNLQPQRPVTSRLRQHGYRVHWSGKTDFNFDPPEGWCDRVSPWWEEPAPEQPFFCYENINVTHESCMFEDRWPEHLSVDPEEVPVPPYLPDLPEMRQQIAVYFHALNTLDQIVGQRLEWLEANGKSEHTLVIFLSDHGRGLPWEKRWCYNAGLHMPLVIRWPGQVEAGSVSNRLVSWVDIAPTLLSVAGVPVPEEFEGCPFLGSETMPEPNFIFAGRDRMGEVYDCVRVVRDQKWHYIRNLAPELPWAQRQNYMEKQKATPRIRELHAAGGGTPETARFFAKRKPIEELYDVESDPDMLRNLAGEGSVDLELSRMRQALENHWRKKPDLGLVPEEELIKQGILKDQLSEFRANIAPLPQVQRLGPTCAPLTAKEAVQGKEGGSDVKAP